MDSAQGLIAVVVVALVFVGGGIGAQYALSDMGSQNDYSEDFEAGSVGTLETFNHSNVDGAYYDRSVNVSGANMGMVEGQDYEWHETNGTLTVESERLANSTAKIDYGYSMPTQAQDDIASTIGYILQTGAWIPLVLIFAVVVLGLGGFSKFS